MSKLLCQKISASHKEELMLIFNEIKALDEDEQFFRPHAFTEEEAEKICNYKGKDSYVLFKHKEIFLAYGMLRGYDEGFEIPSLGIYIKKAYRHKSWGYKCILALHELAKSKGAKKVRLTVMPKNTIALHLYEKMGYKVTEKEENKIIMHIKL